MRQVTNPFSVPSLPSLFLIFVFVFRNASSAAPSVTEAAYALLLDGDVTPEGMEYTHNADEFADQCKAITLQLEEQQNRCACVCVRARTPTQSCVGGVTFA